MRVIGFVALACALLTAGACAEEGDPANSGADVERAIPSGSYTWMLRTWISGTECVEKNIDCAHAMPAWAGKFEVAKDGTISGTGKLGLPSNRGPAGLNPYEIVLCFGGGEDANVARQGVTVSGTVPAHGKAPIRLGFSADIDRDEVREAHCAQAVGISPTKRWSVIDPFLEIGTKTVSARCAADGTEESAESVIVDIGGADYKFRCW